MRILIDTNIFIPLEDSSTVLDDSFSKLVRLANENQHHLLVHPSSIADLKRDSNQDRREINLSRIKKYSILENPPIVDNDKLSLLGLNQSNDNDRVDNDILFALYSDAANILISEDRRLHKKAIILNISDRVHYIQQAADFLRRLHSRAKVTLPNIEETNLHQIDLASPFFDSLRDGYEGFDAWFKSASRQGRNAWIHHDKLGNLGAICIYKEEHDPIVTDDNRAIAGKVLKLCTFKVGDEIRGRKIGELFLKAAFNYATNNDFEHIYLTMRPDEQEFLADLVMDFGFSEFGMYKGDYVYVKHHPPKPPKSDMEPLEYHKHFYPYFKCSAHINKFIIPIQPIYHKSLFPENQMQFSLFSHSVAGNAIKQAYICNAQTKGIAAGDIVCFYRSEDQKAITTIGVVESFENIAEADKILQKVSKRTVYSYADIDALVSKRTKVMLFRMALHLPQPIHYTWLLNNNIIKGKIQSIRSISDESFSKIIREGRIENCVYAH